MNKCTLPQKENPAPFEQFLRDFQSETDRGVALVGATYLDEILGIMLANYFVGDEDVADRLIGPAYPLYTFSVKTDLAYCLGLLSPEIYSDLNIVRKIRNEFSQRHGPADFDSLEVKLQVGDLKASDPPVSQEYPGTSRMRFISRVIMIIMQLTRKTHGIRHA